MAKENENTTRTDAIMNLKRTEQGATLERAYDAGWDAAIDECLNRLHQDTNELAWDAAKDVAQLKSSSV